MIYDNPFYQKLWNTDFTDIEGMILRTDTWQRSKKVKLLKKKLLRSEDIEREINHVHLDVMDEKGNPLDYYKQIDFAYSLKERWLKLLKERFPNREFEVLIEEIPPHQVTLYVYTKRMGAV